MHEAEPPIFFGIFAIGFFQLPQEAASWIFKLEALYGLELLHQPWPPSAPVYFRNSHDFGVSSFKCKLKYTCLITSAILYEYIYIYIYLAIYSTNHTVYYTVPNFVYTKVNALFNGGVLYNLRLDTPCQPSHRKTKA